MLTVTLSSDATYTHSKTSIQVDFASQSICFCFTLGTDCPVRAFGKKIIPSTALRREEDQRVQINSEMTTRNQILICIRQQHNSVARSEKAPTVFTCSIQHV